MPRKPRFQLPGIPQHIVQRGNNRDPCFFAEADYRRYLEDLGNALEANRCDLHAYLSTTGHGGSRTLICLPGAVSPRYWCRLPAPAS